jgi:hypothetical protein
MAALSRGARSMDFWLLALSLGICGFSTNGLINTHLIAYCADHGIAVVTGASVLATLGVFSLIGSALSGWLCDRFNPRVLLFWYYSLRGISLIVVPFSDFDFVSLSIFSVFYGLDWVGRPPPAAWYRSGRPCDRTLPRAAIAPSCWKPPFESCSLYRSCAGTHLRRWRTPDFRRGCKLPRIQLQT